MTRKPIQFMFGDGFGDHPTVLHRKALERSSFEDPFGGDGFWIYLGFSSRLVGGGRAADLGRSAYVERVFDMGRRQVPPWLVIRQTWRHP